ncbi:MAG: glycosyltransferase [Victivallaceae bacterium]
MDKAKITPAPADDYLTKAFAAGHPDGCACKVVSTAQGYFYLLLALGWLFLLKYRWDLFIFSAAAILGFLYSAAVLFRGSASILAIFGCGEDKVKKPELDAMKPEELPVYTVLVPLYREANIVGKLLAGIARLDYPKDKLDVKLLLEANDAETLDALKAHGIPDYCEIIIAPDSLPRTKPRVCNYGLAAARGEFCVIFDAEDAPEPDQLKKALAVFRRDQAGRVACVQAKLNYFNSRTNLLTRLFTVEYSVNFELMLPGLQLFRLPLPLGGTSNHFRTELLRQIGPWDPYNVTEDCDLGIRIYEAGYRTRLVDSTTWEEANSEPGNWLRQRSRWVKGFAQTHLVHYRNPLRTIRKLGLWGAFGGYLAVGGSVLMMLTNVIFWLILLLYGALLIHGVSHGASISELVIGPESGPRTYQGIVLGKLVLRAWPLVYVGATESPVWSLLSQVFFFSGIVLFFSNFFFIGVGVLACCKRKFYHLIPAALLMPFYWVMISLGAWKGFIQLFTNPFYWEKTRHGLVTKDVPAKAVEI